MGYTGLSAGSRRGLLSGVSYSRMRCFCNGATVRVRETGRVCIYVWCGVGVCASVC